MLKYWVAGIERMNNDLIYQDHSRLNEDETVALQERLYRKLHHNLTQAVGIW